MKTPARTLVLLLLFGCPSAYAETYKCTVGGKTVFSDLPCAARANRVDESSDRVSRDARRQADHVNQKNSSQLSELEYRAARDRSYRGAIAEVPDQMPSPTPAPRPRPYYR